MHFVFIAVVGRGLATWEGDEFTVSLFGVARFLIVPDQPQQFRGDRLDHDCTVGFKQMPLQPKGERIIDLGRWAFGLRLAFLDVYRPWRPWPQPIWSAWRNAFTKSVPPTRRTTDRTFEIEQ